MPIYVVCDDFNPITIDNITFLKNAKMISTKYNKLFVIVKESPAQLDIIKILNELRCVDETIKIENDLDTTLKILKINGYDDIIYISKEGEVPSNCAHTCDIDGKKIF